MKANHRLRTWVSVLGTTAIFGLVVADLAMQRGGSAPSVDGKEEEKEAPKKAAQRTWLWGGTIQRNLVNLTERNIADNWSTRKGAEKGIKWSIDLGSKAYGGPIVAGGKIYVGTNNNRPRNKDVRGDKGVLMCFSEATGEFLWQSIHDKLPIGRVQDWPEEGICSSPVVEGDRLWYVSNRCEVICAGTGGLAAGNRGVTDEVYKTKTDADIIWRLDMIKDLGVFPHNLATCSPLIVGDTLFVITSNGVDEGHINIPSIKAPSFLALNKNTGKVIWKSSAPGDKIMHGQWSNPVYTMTNGTPQVIFPGGDGFLYSFNPANGTLLWKFDCNPKGSRYALGGTGTRSDFVCTPVVWENKLYIGVGQDPEHKRGVGHLWCIDLIVALAKGATNPNNDVSPFSPPKEEDPKFDPKDPRNKNSAMLWHYGGKAPAADEGRDYIFGRTLSTCAVHDGLCYAGEYEGVLHCLDAKTGKVYWDHELGADTWSSPYLVDDKIFMANERGEIHIFKPGKKKQLVRKIAMGLPTTRVRTTSVAANGVLYIITENPCKLWAITK